MPKFYKDQDKYAFPLEMSFLASRFQQLKDQLSTQDLFKTFTISDYFINKSLIFAGKTLQKDELALYSKFFNIINASLPKPDLLVYLYLNVDSLKSNIIKRGRSYEQEIKKEYLQKIQDGYFEYIKQLQNQRVVIIDTNQIDFVENEEDYKQLLEIIMQDHSIGIHRYTLESVK